VALFLAVLGVLITFHEFGHFIFAKWFGVRVSNFAIGFGPTIFKWTRGDTTYRLNALPLGGYCQMVGEDQADDGSADPGNFQHHPLWQRFTIIVAGPLFNLLLASFIFAYIGVVAGIPDTVTNVVESVKAGSPAEVAGLRAGDIIETVDGQPFKSGQDLVDFIHARPNQLLDVGIRRGDTVTQKRVRTTTDVQGGRTVGVLGFLPVVSVRHVPLLNGVAYGFTETATFVWLNATGLVQTFAHRDLSNLHGVVGIGRIFVQVEQSGAINALKLVADISALLGFFNLLPIPALDGGRLVFLLVELVRGRPVDPEKEGLVHLTGFALLMVLVLVVTYRDIAMWVAGKGVM
jgi:regulator of sigma E protease